MKLLRVTAGALEKFGACVRQRALFEKTFPNGCAITAANLRKAVNAGMQISWLSLDLRRGVEDALPSMRGEDGKSYPDGYIKALAKAFASTKNVRTKSLRIYNQVVPKKTTKKVTKKKATDDSSSE